MLMTPLPATPKGRPLGTKTAPTPRTPLSDRTIYGCSCAASLRQARSEGANGGADMLFDRLHRQAHGPCGLGVGEALQFVQAEGAAGLWRQVRDRGHEHAQALG